MKTVIAFLLAFMLVGCMAPPKVVPVVEKPKVSGLLAKPPADAMIDPVEPTPLKVGDTKAGNTEIMRQNNLNALKDRTDKRTLQAYIRSIFSEDK